MDNSSGITPVMPIGGYGDSFGGNSFMFIKEFIEDVNCELKYAERKYIDLMSVEYDLSFILEEQKRLHDKYKSML